MSTPRFNLRNASLYLVKLKNKYQQNKQHENKDNTFIDQEDQISSSNNSQSKKVSQKLDSVTDRLFQNHQQSEDIKPQQSVFQSAKQQQQGNSENIRQTFQTTQQSQSKQQQTQFCDLIIIKYLEQTLNIYKADLQTLQHNRENLQQQIYFLGRKIAKLHEISAQNKSLQKQISQLNDQLKLTIAKYHQSNRDVWRQKMELTKIFNRQKNKLKKLLLLGNKEAQDSSFHYFKIDSFGQDYVDTYLQFMEFKSQQQKQIHEKINLHKENQNNLNQQNSKLIQKVFKGKEEIYFRERKIKENPISSKQKTQTSTVVPETTTLQKPKQKKVILYDESQHQAQQEIQKQKPKKLTEAERASLLGDLKNFSKSFKLPK